jgi:hypothetical protein
MQINARRITCRVRETSTHSDDVTFCRMVWILAERSNNGTGKFIHFIEAPMLHIANFK